MEPWASSTSFIIWANAVSFPTFVALNFIEPFLLILAPITLSPTFFSKGKGYEFEPLITVINKGIETKLSVDLSNFDSPEGEYTLLDLNSGETITAFNGKNGIINVEFTIDKSAGYGIIKDNNIIEVIEAVDNINKADLEQIRTKYISQ